MSTVSDWVGEITTTTGQGDIEVGGAIEGYVSFADAGLSRVWYSVIDGPNRESGFGTYSEGTLERTEVYATLEDGVYNGNQPPPLDLSGLANVYCTFNAEAFNKFESTVNGVVVATPGSVLDDRVNNELQLTGDYFLPPASSIEANRWVTVTVTSTHSGNSQRVNAQPGDTIESVDGVDPDGVVEFLGQDVVHLISDGVSKWRI